MSPDQVWIVAIVVIYMVVLLGIGGVAARLTRSSEDFYVAGRSLGSWVTAISSTAASESGWVVLGAVGMVYAGGVSAMWFAPGCLAGYAVNLYWLAPRLRAESARSGAFTVPDLLVGLVGRRSPLLRVVSVVMILACLGGYVAAQMTATGKAMEAIVGLQYWQGVLIGGSIIVLYTLLGGFRAVAWTDFFQGLVMVAALVIMPVVVVVKVGGYGAMLDKLGAAHGGAYVAVLGGKTGFALFGLVTGLFGIGLGYPGQPHVVTRYMAAESAQKIRQTQLIAMVWGVLVFFGAGLLGLAGRLLLPDLADPEQLFPLAARRMLHPLLAGVMLAAILSAIMSTVSSQLLVAASALSRDLLEEVFGVARGGRASVITGRLAVLVLGALAVVVSFGKVRGVFWFVLFAWSGLGAAFGPTLLIGLTRGRLSLAGAVAGVVTGFGVTVAWKLSGLSERWIYELVPAFTLATVATLVGDAVAARRKGDLPAAVVAAPSVEEQG